MIAKGRRIRELSRLVETYGGVPSLWVKKSCPILDENGDIIEYHWYEHPDIGRVEIKKKWIEKR